MKKKGILLVCEGIDGSGKTSLSRRLADLLKADGHDILLTREPGGTELGVSLRKMLHDVINRPCPMAEYLLFAADRAEHATRVVIPALQRGAIVISDRMGDSSLAYQGFGRGVDRSMIASINAWAQQGIKTDITLYLHLDATTAKQRITSRSSHLTSFEREEAAFWERVIAGFEAIFANRDDVIRLDARQSLDALADAAYAEVKNRFPRL